MIPETRTGVRPTSVPSRNTFAPAGVDWIFTEPVVGSGIGVRAALTRVVAPADTLAVIWYGSYPVFSILTVCEPGATPDMVTGVRPTSVLSRNTFAAAGVDWTFTEPVVGGGVVAVVVTAVVAVVVTAVVAVVVTAVVAVVVTAVVAVVVTAVVAVVVTAVVAVVVIAVVGGGPMMIVPFCTVAA